jgi:flagella basal body P-ring formation protein FlgA
VERFLQPLELKNSNSSFTTKQSYLISSSQNLSSIDQAINSRVLRHDDVETLLADAIHNRYQVNGDIVVNLSSKWTPIESESKVLLKIKDCSPDELSSSCFIRFSLWESGKKIGDFSSPVRISHLQDIYYADTSLPRAKKLHASDFSSRKVDVLKSHANSVPSSSNLSGYELQTNLTAGSPLKWSYLGKATVLRKGQVVDVFASGHGIYVTMKGLVLEDGSLDSFVRIKNLSSEKEFNAKVISGNSVKVNL